MSEVRLFTAEEAAKIAGLALDVAERAYALSADYPLERAPNAPEERFHAIFDWIAFGGEDRPGVGLDSAARYMVAELAAAYGPHSAAFDQAGDYLRHWFRDRKRRAREAN